MSNHTFIMRVSLALLVGSLTIALLPISRAQISKDSKEVSELLSDVKSEAIQLNHDADELQLFMQSDFSRETQVRKLAQVREHINAAGGLLQKLENLRHAASPWQEQAIDRITPLLKELASSVTSTIEHLNEKPNELRTSPYMEYVAANYDMACKITELISDYVEYGKSKAKAEELGAKLSPSGK